MMPAAPPRSKSGWLLLLALVALVVASFASLPLQLAAFFSAEALATTTEFLQGFAPPEMATPFLMRCLNATAETLSMSALGTLLAVFGGLGQRMDESTRMMAGGEVSTMLIMFVALVALADVVSKMLRRRLG